jgi:hypothetical protein
MRSKRSSLGLLHILWRPDVVEQSGADITGQAADKWEEEGRV